MFTAADALKLFDNKFGGEYLLGATSHFLAKVLDLQRVPFEAVLHGTQWGNGSASENGRSNSVFFIEAYVNFGILGVVIFGLIAGQCFRMFWKSDDEALKAIWPLFALALFSSGLIGNMLSNGFALFILMALFVSRREKTAAPSSMAALKV